jgi:ribose transport system substrate-binding protein
MTLKLVRNQPRLRWIALLSLALGALIVAGCGSSGSSSSSGGGESTPAESEPASSSSSDSSGGSSSVAASTKAIEEAEKPVEEWTGPTEAFTPPTGKNVTIVSCGNAGAGCRIGSEAAVEAGKVLGWNTKVVDGKFEPPVWNSAVRQAASEGADAILLYAIDPSLIREGLSLAQKKHIPLVDVFVEPESGAPKVDGYVEADSKETGELLADNITSVSGGHANLLLMESPEYPSVVQQNAALLPSLEKDCPECKVTKSNVNATTMAEKLPGQISALLQSNPEIEYIQSPYDPAIEFIAQGIRQAGKTGSVKLLGTNGQPVGLEYVAEGEMLSDLAYSTTYSGWLAMEMLARILAGKPHELVESLPQRMFTEKNIGEIESGQEWNLEFDYVKKLEELWGK